MTIIEMLNEIGAENMEFQLLLNDLVGTQRMRKGFTELSFGTKAITLTDIMNNNPPKIGVLVWIPVEKWDAIRKKVSQQ